MSEMLLPCVTRDGLMLLYENYIIIPDGVWKISLTSQQASVNQTVKRVASLLTSTSQLTSDKLTHQLP